MAKLIFTEHNDEELGKILEVHNKKGEWLGTIQYHKPWKCHVWTQEPDIAMSSVCLRQIDARCVELDGGVSK